MNCNCRWCEGIIAVVILIVTIWPNLIGVTASMWVIIIAAAILLLHSIFHHKCGCGMCMTEGMSRTPTTRRKRR